MSFTLPQANSLEDRRKRSAALDKVRLEWAWDFPKATAKNLPKGDTAPARPPIVKSLPSSEVGSDELQKVLGLGEAQMKSRAEAYLERFKRGPGENKADPFAAYADYWDEDSCPWVMKKSSTGDCWNWQRDDVFANQRLYGISPELIRRCTKLPANVPVKDADCVLPAGETIQSLIDKGLMYMTSHEVLENYPVEEKEQFVAAPTCLFYVDLEKKCLMPLCIQLFQQPNSTNPVFTPKDKPGTWLLAKLYANNADLIVHTAVKHFMRMHFVNEIVYISANRSMSQNHPILNFLKPSFYMNMFAGETSRGTQLTDSSWWLIEQEWPKWDFSDYDVPGRFERLGVHEADKLPNFYFRDDALEYWAVMLKYCTEMIDHIYNNDDAEVLKDNELQAWFAEMANPIRGGIKGLPLDKNGHMATRKDLAYFAPVCVAPKKLRNTAPPRTKDDVSLQKIAEALPTGSEAVAQISDIDAVELSSVPGKPQWNGVGSFDHFPNFMKAHSEEAHNIAASYTNALYSELQPKLAQRATERQSGRDEDVYWCMDPSRCANSIWN